ncbi:aminoacyl tRNA synthase complex-interacting multifunctional protein 2 isoform X2 [Maniola hyperantus]|uniref:aminoacyl tRNA synthase complex-interacting multifunctional protein 2 isoform X2 n=1 Tax=Aphantopus hyperantus TaxID=2795564 RepID=UPI00156827CF|nr:uncharacterized protein LOC117996308 isoform X2 [Maniola hyperantus]
MYHMKNLVSQEQSLVLPKCMYYIKNPIEGCLKEEMEINVCDQKMPNTQLIELEGRQDKLLEKLDNLYERIKSISSLCNINIEEKTEKVINIISSEEIVVVLNPNVLPWFLNKFLKEIPLLNVTWHVHSSVPTEKIPIIDAFFGKYQDLYRVKQGCKINLRLIFKCESTTPELKFSSLSFPILGAVNIIRYLCLTYDNIAPYDYCNYEVDAMLDSAYQLETASEKSRALLISKIFPQSKEWIYRDRFSIIDLAVFNVVIQLQNGIKYVPKKWFNNCEKMIL